MRRSRSLLLVPLLVVVAMLTAVPPAQAAGTGSISGRLLAKPTGGTAAPYPSGGVQVYYNDTAEFFDATIVEPYPEIGDDGRFTLANLEDGYYWLRAYGSDAYAIEYYPNAFHYSTATPVHVTGGAVTLAENIVLEAPGAVTGRVLDAAGRPVAGATIGFYDLDGRGGPGTTADADGRFDTRGEEFLEMVPGTYLMEVGAWPNDLSRPVYRTTRVQVTFGPGQVLSRDVALEERPSAVFTVLDPAGQPLPGAQMIIQQRDPDVLDGGWNPIQSGPHVTDQTGRFRFVDGIDEVRFQVRPPQGYAGPAVPEWWDDAATFEQARTLTFPAGVEARRDFTIQLGTTTPGTTPGTPPGTTPAPGTLKGAKPKIAGKARLGRILKVRAGTWKPGKVTLKYTWFRGAKRIPKATKASYRLTRQDLGKRVSVRVTGTKQGYRSVTVRSAQTPKVRR